MPAGTDAAEELAPRFQYTLSTRPETMCLENRNWEIGMVEAVKTSLQQRWRLMSWWMSRASGLWRVVHGGGGRLLGGLQATWATRGEGGEWMGKAGRALCSISSVTKLTRNVWCSHGNEWSKWEVVNSAKGRRWAAFSFPSS